MQIDNAVQFGVRPQQHAPNLVSHIAVPGHAIPHLLQRTAVLSPIPLHDSKSIEQIHSPQLPSVAQNESPTLYFCKSPTSVSLQLAGISNTNNDYGTPCSAIQTKYSCRPVVIPICSVAGCTSM